MSTQPGATTDFSARLQAALGSAKGQRVKAAAPATVAPVSAPVDDQFNQRLSAAMGQARGDAATTAEAEAAVAGSGPVGQGDYVVRLGDCISSIALDHGFFHETVWNDEANAQLREVRKNPNVLLAGDRVTIPEKRRKDESLAPEQRHRFLRKGCPETLQIRFEDEDKVAYASEAYTIEIDGETREGFTDGDGAVRESIPPDADRVTITFPAREEAYTFRLGTLPPIETIEGVQARLNNLGYACGPPTGEMNGATQRALRNYQSDFELADSDGQPDAATRAHLLERHGS